MARAVLLNELTIAMAQAHYDAPDDATRMIGLALEYRFQVHFQPFFNVKKKRRDGTMSPLDLASSGSRAARLSAIVETAFTTLLPIWEAGTAAVRPSEGASVSYEHGVVVFPPGHTKNAT